MPALMRVQVNADADQDDNSSTDSCKRAPSTIVQVSRSRFRELVQKHMQTLIASLHKSGDNKAKLALQTHMWNDFLDVLHLDPLEKKLSPARREASAILRFVTFGELPLPGGSQDPTSISQEVIGTKDQVCILWQFWRKLDYDKSDMVDVGEFRHCVHEKLQSRFKDLSPEQTMNLPAWAKVTVSEECYDGSTKLVFRLCDKMASHLFGKKSLFSLEHLMGLIWPRAAASDVKTMKEWFHEISEEASRMRVSPPAVLDSTEYQDLCEVFRYFDAEKCGRLSLENLVSLGIIYPDQLAKACKEWDGNGDGMLDEAEFCEMLCPLGCRASQQSTVGTLEDGSRVIFNPGVGYWQLEQDASATVD
jgi:Ca2+-binding EF-hand superfamily protein